LILEELAMADDDPSDVAHERIAELVLGDHALGRPIGGNPETIKSSERESVVNHYTTYYRPYELVVTAAGGLEHKDVVTRVIDALTRSGWDLSGTHAPAARRSTGALELSHDPRALVISRPLEQAVVALASPGLRASDPRRHAMSVLSSVLGGGMSSRLFQEVREKRGLAYSVYSFASSYADAGMFGMAAGTSPANATTVAQLLRDELDSVATSGISSEELARTVGNLSGASALALESTEVRMMRLGRSELGTGEYVDRDEGLARLATVGLEDVQALARDLVHSPLSAVVVGAVKDGIVDDVVRPGALPS
jgi:predicted Zn-dependent peptidase